MARHALQIPSPVELASRVERFHTLMRREGLEWVALAGPDIHRFFTNLHGMAVTRPIWLIIPSQNHLGFVSPGSEVKEIQARCNTPVLAQWVEWEEDQASAVTHQDALAEYLARVAPPGITIGVDFGGTSGLNIELVKQALGGQRIRDITTILHQLFDVKDEAAKRVIRASCDVVAQEMKSSIAAAVPGVSGWEVSKASFNAGTDRAAELWNANEEQSPLAHGLHMTGSGPGHTARCHAPGGGRVIRDGEVVQICRCSTGIFGHLVGYDRPLVVGTKSPTNDMLKILRYARESQKAALDSIRAGVRAGDVHEAAMEVIRCGGWANPILHRTGRSIGYSGADGRELKAGSQHVLQVDEYYTVEPGIYVDGVGGARFGDTVRVTEQGCEIVTDFELGRQSMEW